MQQHDEYDAMQSSIRHATRQDIETVAGILREAARWLEQSGMGMWRDGELAASRITGDVDAGLFFIAECDGEAAGVVKFQMEDDLFWPDVPKSASAFVHRLAVRRRFAGRGISSALLSWAVERARLLGRYYLRLDCEASRPRLRAVYERFGFHHHSDRQVGPYFVSRYEYRVAELACPNWRPRLARENDIPALQELIPLSVRTLQASYYSTAQMEAALGPVFGVDRQLIRDGTYFVVEQNGQIMGCGGWSKRRSLFGGDHDREEPDAELDPGCDAARIRAFFVHPAWARRGIGRSIMAACERAIITAGFRNVEIVATLAGEPLYASFGYSVVQRFEMGMAGGMSLPVVRMTKKIQE